MRQRICAALVLPMLFVGAVVSLSAETSQEKRQQTQARPLLPKYPANPADPAFVFDVTNETRQLEDVDADMLNVKLLLDGQGYVPAGVFHSGGKHALRPGETQSFTLSIGNFRMDENRQKLVTLLPLPEGRHTIRIRFGGKEYGPLTFLWGSENPFGKK